MLKIAVVALTVAATTSFVHADPSVTAQAPAASSSAEPDSYVSGGVIFGGNDGLMTGAWRLELGHRIANTGVWLHGVVSLGASEPLFGSGTGSFQQVRAGVEGRSCAVRGVLCFVASADVGVQHVHWTGVEGLFPESSDPQMTIDSVRGVVVPRVGLDFGSKHFRFRPGLDLVFSNDGVDGADVTFAVAAQW